MSRHDTDFYFGGFMGAVRANLSMVDPRYLYYQLRHDQFNSFLRDQISGANINNLGAKLLYQFQIPLPPLDVQEEIVAEIEGYQKVIDGARAVVENYRPHIHVDPDWPMVEIGQVCRIINGSTPSRKEPAYWKNGTVPWFTVDDIRENGQFVHQTIQFTTEKALADTSLKLLPRNTVLLCCTASVGACAFAEIELTTNQQFNGLVVNDCYSKRLLPRFLFYFASQLKNELLKYSGKTSFNFVSGRALKAIRIPLPPLTVQQVIVDNIEAEQSLVNANRELLERFEKKIQDAIARVWGSG